MILGYTRISEDETDADRLYQEEVIRSIGYEHGAGPFDVVIYSDVCPATLPFDQRDGGGALLKDIKPGDIMVARGINRLCAAPSELIALRDRIGFVKANFIIADLGNEPLVDNVMFCVLTHAFSEMEHLKAPEIRPAPRPPTIGGHPPYGYRLTGNGAEKKLEPDPNEQNVIAVVKTLHEQTHPPQFIAKELAMLGLRNRAGGPFQYVQVQRIIEKLNAADPG